MDTMNESLQPEDRSKICHAVSQLLPRPMDAARYLYEHGIEPLAQKALADADAARGPAH